MSSARGVWWVRPVVALVLPLATRWVISQEKQILSEGRELTETEKADASDIGVRSIDDVRVRVISPVPTPGNRFLTWLAKLTRCPLTQPPCGMALGHGIYLDAFNGMSRETLRHELVHVRQYEMLGGIRPFLSQYLWECLAVGYDNAPMEHEAILISLREKNSPS